MPRSCLQLVSSLKQLMVDRTTRDDLVELLTWLVVQPATKQALQKVFTELFLEESMQAEAGSFLVSAASSALRDPNLQVAGGDYAWSSVKYLLTGWTPPAAGLRGGAGSESCGVEGVDAGAGGGPTSRSTAGVEGVGAGV
jgi:hypothetical protein